MRNRVLIFDDQEGIRQLLWSLFDRRGYEVFTFPHPAICPLSNEKECPCLEEQACSDIILSDLSMPYKDGMSFLEEQIKKGCKCKHIALMSGDFNDNNELKANLLGIKTFKKPFNLNELTKWLDQVEKDIDPKRKLSDWFSNR